MYLASNLRNTLTLRRQSGQLFVVPSNINKVYIRTEVEFDTANKLKDLRIYLNQTEFSKWLSKEKGENPAHVLAALESQGVILSKGRRANLGAGTIFSTGTARMLYIDGNHPELRGEFVPELMLDDVDLNNPVEELKR